jgi:hypothetical protein
VISSDASLVAVSITFFSLNNAFTALIWWSKSHSFAAEQRLGLGLGLGLRSS